MFVGFFFVEFDLISKFRNIETIAWTTVVFGILLYGVNLVEKASKRFRLQISAYNRANANFIFSTRCSRSGIAITARLLSLKELMQRKFLFLSQFQFLELYHLA